MWSVFKRELKSYFYSPLAYVLTAVYIFLVSYKFMGPILLANGPVQTLFGGVVYDLCILLAFIIPILTMRVLADEKRNGTEVLLMTSPNSVPSIVFAKFLAAFMVYMLMISLTAIYPIIIAVSGKLNVASMITSYIGYIFVGALFVAFGVFTSSLTENQIVSAVIGSLGLFFIWVIRYFSQGLKGFAYDFIEWIAIYNRFFQFVQGQIYLKDFVFFFSMIGVFLALAMIIVEKKRWSQG